MPNRPLVIVTRKLPDIIETRMCELFNTKLNIDDTPMSQSDLVEAAKTADILVPTVTDKIDSGVIGQSGEKLKLIANFGTGVDNIDVETARTRGITVSNTPGRADRRYRRHDHGSDSRGAEAPDRRRPDHRGDR